MIKDSVEKWKDIADPLYGQYFQVSNLGRIKSKGRMIERGGTSNRYSYFKPESLIKSRRGVQPHLFVSLNFTHEGKKYNKTYYVHKAAAEAFLPRPSRKHVYVTHKDWNYENNNVKNLRWITASENSKRNLELYPENVNKLRDRNVENGYYESLKAPARIHSKLIKKLRGKMGTVELGEIFNCSSATISNIQRGK
jgi:hypothetical protein